MSPIERLLQAMDESDLEAMVALFAPDAHFRTVDGQRVEGADGVRDFFAELLSTLRSTTHVITHQWQLDDVWIAEGEATYELQDWLQLGPLPRAFIAHDGPEGIAELHVYGAHERPVAEHRTGDEGMWIGGRWIPPL
jgi:hypothetical protein